MSKRSYAQACPIALALDSLGDRWALLILRELRIGPRRFTDIRTALPGIASNLLSDRLRELHDDGWIEQRLLDPPAARTVYALSARGLQAAPVLDALARFGAAQLDPPAAKRRLSPERAVRCLIAAFHSPEPTAGPFRARLHVDGRCADIVTTGADLELQMAGPSAPDIEVTTTVADLVTARQGGALCLPPGPASTRFARLFSLETSEP
jgi:DNA-binding HxlR family transcriptional regulator